MVLLLILCLDIESENIFFLQASPPQGVLSYEDDTGAQIAFLNSIIGDMQKKNETLMSKVQLLETGGDLSQ